MNPTCIVAIEIGSSKIKGLVASTGDLGELRIAAVEEVRVNNCVRYGKIQNVQEVSAHVNDIIRKLENRPGIAPRKVTDIYIAVGARSLSTVIAHASAKFPNAVEITGETIQRLKRDARLDAITDKEHLDTLPHAFFVDNALVNNVVGTIGSNIRAEFTAIVISPTVKRNLELIKFDGRTVNKHYIVRPTAIADFVLSPSERQIGCALADLGAETTTITVYKDGVLQSAVTLPIGSRNITRDLMTGLSMTEESADDAKMRLSSSEPATDADIEINSYISARAGEIVANILHQLDLAGFKAASLPAGIVLTGGGSRLHSIGRLLESQSKMPVRTAVLTDSQQRLVTGDYDRSADLDIIAIARAAALAGASDCLTPLPGPEEERESRRDDDTADYYGGYAGHGGDAATGYPRRRTVADDDTLLQDDDDDETFDDVRPSGKTRKVKASHTRRTATPDPVRDDDDDDDGSYDGEPEHSRGRSIIEDIRQRLTNFWTNDRGSDDEDLDSPLN